MLYRLVQAYEDLASILAQRNDINTTGDEVLSEGGENSAIIIEQVEYTFVCKTNISCYLSLFHRLQLGIWLLIGDLMLLGKRMVVKILLH